jgi:hypothetical protein
MDKPIPKKPVQNAETVFQRIDVMNKQDKPASQNNKWLVEVHPHPVVKSRYSYSLTISGRARRNPSPIDDNYPNLFGCFATEHEAYEAGMEEVESE